ncbi:kanadaptin [Epargyreus clarus]|uniref:kanadaptin n=1 Tax=Epargyreus clarus TaxID=520877 RepID=UPI003C2ADD10
MADEKAGEIAPKNPDKIEFKKPVLVGRIGKLPKKAKPETEQGLDTKKIEIVEPPSNSTSSLPPAVLLKELSTPIPYKEPKWSGLCPDGSEYALEVLKSGMIVERVDLTKQPYFVFGRLANCNVVMAHPTISRHHAVLQYKAFAEDGEPPSGWYLYDLGSTHGTFLNRDKLKPQHYTRVRVGHQIKFGTSTRTYIMLGPDFDCEGESELSVTEIKQKAQDLKLERDRMIKEAIEQRERDKIEEEKRREEQGIDWGMGEDAEEEPDLADNPYAMAANEELYLDDPKKTLRGYYEREGHELSYDCEERGVGQYICRVELPIDDARGRPVVAEVIHRGKKKEAVVACALEACRILDRAGLLRQSKHESRRRKQRDWSADDYYDSDEDTFLDRTGAVESKRRTRMQKHGALAEDAQQPRGYEELLKEISEIEKKISAEQKVLERLRASSKQVKEDNSGEDALDEFMSSLGSQGTSMAQKAEISKTKMSIQKLKAELSRTQRLAELARPALAPVTRAEDRRLLKQNNSVVYGKRIKLKEDIDKKPKVRKEVKAEETEFVEEMDSDDEIKEEAKKQTEDKSPKTEQVEKHIEARVETEGDLEKHKDGDVKKEAEVKSVKEDSSKDKRVFGPMRPPENYVVPESYFDQETDRDLPEIDDETL